VALQRRHGAGWHIASLFSYLDALSLISGNIGKAMGENFKYAEARFIIGG
jgi:hypothetical protein